MRIHATINERTLRRTFREHLNGNRALTVFDNDLRGFALKVSANGNKTFFVRAARTLGMAETVLGTAEKLTAAQAREKAAAVIEAAKTEREHGPLFGDFADEFLLSVLTVTDGSAIGLFDGIWLMTGAMPGRGSRWRGGRRGVEGCGSRDRFRGTPRECGNRDLGTAGHRDDGRRWQQRMTQPVSSLRWRRCCSRVRRRA